MRDVDWAKTPVGQPKDWPSQLRTAVEILLGSFQPMVLVWGPDLTTFYNDAFIPICGKRHPAIGLHHRDLWHDCWDKVGPIIESAYRGQSTSREDIQIPMHRNDFPEVAHFSFSFVPLRGETNKVLGAFCTCVETTARVVVREQKRFEVNLLRQMFDQAPGGVAILQGPHHVFQITNPAYDRLIGRGNFAGKAVREALPELRDQGFFQLLDHVYQTGETHVGTGIPFVLQASGEPGRERFLDFVYQPLRDPDGSVGGIFVQALDVTERVRAEQGQEVLNHELAHRLKNQLAMIQAIVSQTMRSAPDLDAARKSISDRIQVLSKAHDMIQSGINGRANMLEIMEAVVDLHGDPHQPQITMQGPQIEFDARQALSLSLILHELATNAFKHGALSVPQGRVAVDWSLETSDAVRHFVLHWVESNGPVVSQPVKTSSGTRLIKAGLAGALRCATETIYDPAGLRFCLTADLAEMRD